MTAGERPDAQGARGRDAQGTPGGEARERRRRLWRGEAATMPMPIVSSLKGTPFRVGDVPDITTGEQAREALELAAKTGDLMIRCGASTRDAETGIIAVAAALGLSSFEVDITNQAITIQSHHTGRRPMIELRVVRSSTRDLARLTAVHGLVADIAHRRISAQEASERLRAIRRRPRFWPRWAITVAYALMAACVTLMLGGNAVAVVVGGLSVALVDRLGRLLSRFGLATYYQSAVGGAVATLLAWATYVVGLHVDALHLTTADFAYAVAGGIVVLLPGRATVSALEDAITGFPVTASGRLLNVAMTAAGIIVGVAFALSLSLRLDEFVGVAVDRESIVAHARPPVHVVAALAAAGSAVASAVSQRTLVRLLLPTGAIGATGYLGTYLLQEGLGLGRLSAITLACLAMGFVARVLGQRLRVPTAVLVTPAVSPLMPGLTIFQGMYELVLGSVERAGSGLTSTGVTTLFGAAATALAIATGALLGESLAAPLVGTGRRVRGRRR